MTYRLPSLNGLRAFEASARHLSFKHAAVELCVTAGAVSQQVKALEASIGVALFRRHHRGLLLTKEGEEYLEPISSAFKIISRATDEVSTTLKSRTFRLGISSSISDEDFNLISNFQDDKTGGPIVIVSRESDTAKLLSGELDALLRSQLKSHPGLHLDQLELINNVGNKQLATLALMPGISGCREHQLLLKAFIEMSK